MFKKILGTGAARAVNVLTQMATLIMGTKFLGAAEWGKAFIAQTDITLASNSSPAAGWCTSHHARNSLR